MSRSSPEMIRTLILAAAFFAVATVHADMMDAFAIGALQAQQHQDNIDALKVAEINRQNAGAATAKLEADRLALQRQMEQQQQRKQEQAQEKERRQEQERQREQDRRAFLQWQFDEAKRLSQNATSGGTTPAPTPTASDPPMNAVQLEIERQRQLEAEAQRKARAAF